jgi:hypothetical protein
MVAVSIARDVGRRGVADAAERAALGLDLGRDDGDRAVILAGDLHQPGRDALQAQFVGQIEQAGVQHKLAARALDDELLADHFPYTPGSECRFSLWSIVSFAPAPGR